MSPKHPDPPFRYDAAGGGHPLSLGATGAGQFAATRWQETLMFQESRTMADTGTTLSLLDGEAVLMLWERSGSNGAVVVRWRDCRTPLGGSNGRGLPPLRPVSAEGGWVGGWRGLRPW